MVSDTGHRPRATGDWHAGTVRFVIVATVLASLGCSTRPHAHAYSSLSNPPGLREPAAIPATELFPLGPRQARFEFVAGPLTGTTVNYRFEADGNQWRQMLEGLRTVTLHRRDDGAIVIASEQDIEANALVSYDPALVMLPAQVRTSPSVRGRAEMTVRNLNDHSLRAKGTCHYQVQMLGTSMVTTPAGKFEAVIVRTVRRISLPLADVTVTIHTAYVLDRGKIAEHIERVTRTLGTFSFTRVSDMRLGR